MKKRILSFLLVLCMLVGMVPVTAAIAEETKTENTEENANYAESYLDLYVTDGLVVLFDAGKESADLIAFQNGVGAGGSWKGYTVDAATGKLVVNEKYKADPHGGAYDASSNPLGWKKLDGAGIAWDEKTSYNANNNYLHFDKTWLPAGYFRVDVVFAPYLRDYVTDTKETVTVTLLSEDTAAGTKTYLLQRSTNWSNDGIAHSAYTLVLSGATASQKYDTPTIGWGTSKDAAVNKSNSRDIGDIQFDASGKATVDAKMRGNYATITLPASVKIESVTAWKNGNENGYYETMVIGNLYGYTWTNRQASNTWANGFGTTRWTVSKGSWGSGSANQSGDGVLTTNKSYVDKSTFVTYDRQIELFTVINDTTRYLVKHGSATILDKTLSSTDRTGANFKILHRLPGAAYGMRVYNKALTEAQQKQNRFADLCSIYGLDVSNVDLNDTEKLNELYDFFTHFSYQGEDSARLQATLDNLLTGAPMTEYDQLYVSDGLVGLYTAFDQDEAARVAAGHVWQDKISGESAVISGNAWQVNADTSNGISTGRWSSAQWTANRGTNGIAFPNAYVEGDAYTIETVIDFYTLSDATGTQYFGNRTQVRMNLVALTSFIGNSGSNAAHMRGVLTYGNWSNNGGHNGSGGIGFKGETSGYRSSSINFTSGKVVTMLATQEKLANDGGVRIGLAYDGATSINNLVITNAQYTEQQKAYTPTEGKLSFLNGAPGTMYALRAYDRILGETEKKQNKAVDLLAYFGVDVSAIDEKRFSKQHSMINAITAYTFANGSKETLQAIVDRYAEHMEMSDYDMLYVQDGLVGLYTAYGTDDNGGENSLVITDGKITGWFDKVAGEQAVVYGDKWKENYKGHGGFSTSIKLSEWSSSTLNSYVDFSDAYADLPNFTVETIMAYETLTKNDGSGRDTTQKYSTNYTIFRIDLYSGMWFNGGSITNRAYLSNNPWGSGGTAKNAMYAVNGQWTAPADGDYKEYNGVNMYVGNGYSMSVGAVYNQTFLKQTSETDVRLALTLDGAYKTVNAQYNYNKVSFGGALTDGRIPIDEYNAAKAHASSNLSKPFSLLNGIPGDLYSVRIYDRVLTADEVKRNHFADLCAYFNLDISALSASGDVTVATLIDIFSTYSFTTGNAVTLQSYITQYTTEVTLNEYDTLYVGADGSSTANGGKLVGLFTAYDAYDPSVLPAIGVWVNKMGGENATIKGNFVANYDGDGGFGIAQQTNTEFNAGHNFGVRFADSYADLPSFTVENVVRYRSFSVGDGEIFDGTAAAQRYDLMAGFIFNGANKFHVRVMLTNVNWSACNTDGSNSARLNGTYGAYCGNGFGLTKNKLITHTFYKNTSDAGVYFGIYVDGKVTYNEGGFHNEGTISASLYNTLKAKSGLTTGKFSTLNGTSGTLYAVRIYDAKLTEAESKRNHFVDIIAYHELDIKGLEIDNLPSALLETFAVTPVDFADSKYLQLIIDEYRYPKPVDYTSLYVTNGLVALYDAFSGSKDTVSLESGKWYAQTVNGNGELGLSSAYAATIAGGAWAESNQDGWKVYENGGFGYLDTAYTASGNGLQLSASLLANNFEVETVLKTTLRSITPPIQTITTFTETENDDNTVTYSGSNATNWRFGKTLTVTFRNDTEQTIEFKPSFMKAAAADAGTASTAFATDVAAISLAGGAEKTVEVGGYMYTKFAITVPKGITVTAVMVDSHSNASEATADMGFVFGNLYAMTWTNLQGSNSWGNGFGTTRWYIANSRWGVHNGNAANAAYHSGLGDKNDFKDLNEKITVLRVTRQKGDVDTYTVAHGNSYSLSGSSNKDKTLASPAFALGQNISTDFFALRVYNRTLETWERNRNHTADLFGFSGASLALYLSATEQQKKDIDTALAKVELTEPATVKAEIEKTIAMLLHGNAEEYLKDVVSFDKLEPLAGKPGYRVIYRVDDATIELLKQFGYTGYYGVVVGGGKDETVFTVKYENGAVIADSDNMILLPVYGGENASGKYCEVSLDERYFSAVVHYDDADKYGADTVVRAYFLAVDEDGKVTIVYDSAEMPENAHNMIDLADYFVNYYDASASLATEYMNNKVLLDILADAGKSARTHVEAEHILHIYVDPTGYDNALGTAAAPYATIEKAYDRALEAYAAGKKSVVIHLSAGVHRMSETVTLDGKELGDRELMIVGEGDDTIVTSTVSVGTATNGQIQLDGKPSFRYLYAVGADGKLTAVELTHTGSAYDYKRFTADPVVDETAGTVYVLMDASLFKGNKTYKGTEVHIITEWDFNILHIDHVDYAATQPNGAAVGAGYVMVYLNYNEYEHFAIPKNHTWASAGGGKQYWIENSADVFADNAAGEDVFYYDEATGIIYISDNAGDATLNANTVYEIPTLCNLFVFKNAKNVTLRDFAMTGLDNDYIAPNRSYAGGQAGNASSWNSNFADTAVKASGMPTLAAVYGEHVDNFRVFGLHIYEVAGDGLNFRGAVTNLRVEDCVIEHVGQTALRVGKNNGNWAANNKNQNVYIGNNVFRHTGELFIQSCGMLVSNGINIRIIGNTITDTSYTAISIGWRWNEATWGIEMIGKDGTTNLYQVEIAYNYIASFMTCMLDGGGIYTLGGNAANDVTEYFNYMHDNYMVVDAKTGQTSRKVGRQIMGYYHDGASSNWYDYNNVIINTVENSTLVIVPMYVQHIDGQLTHNVKLEGNYVIGFDVTVTESGSNWSESVWSEKIQAALDAAAYRTYIVADRNITADDNVWADVTREDYRNWIFSIGLSKSTTTTKWEDTVSDAEKLPVAHIYATAGSSLTENGEHGLEADIISQGVAQSRVYVIGNEDHIVLISDFLVIKDEDGRVLETLYAANGTVILPATKVYGDKTVVAWKQNGALITDLSVGVTADDDIIAVTIATPKTNDGVSVRVGKTHEYTGIRFTSTIARADYDKLVALYGVENLTFGTLITPEDFVTQAGAFTTEALEKFAADNGKSAEDAYLKLSAAERFNRDSADATEYIYAGSIVNMMQENLDVKFASVMFIDVDADKDGETDFTVYGAYNGTTNRSFADVATPLYNAILAGDVETGLDDQQKGWFLAVYENLFIKQ